MAETYYQIVEKGKEDKNGNVVKLSVNGLEVVAGEQSFSDGRGVLEYMEILSNSYKILDINEKYKFFPLEEEKARLLIRDYGDFVYASTFSVNLLTGEDMPDLGNWRDI